MDDLTSNAKQFHTLAAAIAFISECVESNSALDLFNHTASAASQKDPNYFIQSVFPALQQQFQVMDFRVRYEGHAFPENVETFKLGGHDKELGHMHIDFLKLGNDWVIDKIWQCR